MANTRLIWILLLSLLILDLPNAVLAQKRRKKTQLWDGIPTDGEDEPIKVVVEEKIPKRSSKKSEQAKAADEVVTPKMKSNQASYQAETVDPKAKLVEEEPLPNKDTKSDPHELEELQELSQRQTKKNYKLIRENKAQMKISNLRDLLSVSNTYTIPLPAAEYETYVAKFPRPYTVVIMFYMKNPEHEEILEQYRLAAQQFKHLQLHKTRKQGDKMHRPIFFLEISRTYTSGQDDFDQFQLESAPAFFVSNGQEFKLTDKLEAQLHIKQNLWKVSSSDGIIDAQKITVFISSKIGIDIRYKEPIWTFLVGLVYLCFLLYIGFYLYKWFYWIIQSPKLWLLAFLAVYYFSTSTVVWMLLNPCNWLGEFEGAPEYIHPSGSIQHMFEGLMFGGLITSFSVLIAIFFWLNWVLKKDLYRRVASCVMLTLIVLWFYWIEAGIKKKQFYDPSFKPPDYTVRGPLRKDQGHII